MIVYRDMTGAHAVATRAIVLALLYAVAGALALGMMALLIMRYVSGKLYEGRTAAGCGRPAWSGDVPRAGVLERSIARRGMARDSLSSTGCFSYSFFVIAAAGWGAVDWNSA